jgi:CubicO group peptidase (beta-lactamase class C family)
MRAIGICKLTTAVVGVAVAAVLTAMAGTARAEQGLPAGLASAEFSSDGIDAIQSMLDGAVADGRIPAAIAMLADDSRIAWIGTAGKMTADIPMRSDAILPLASVGKMYTATAAMLLYERGSISLDDPVSDYIPEFAEVRVQSSDAAGTPVLVPAETPISIFHLLTHTSGLTVTGDEFWATWDRHVGKTTTAAFARDLATLPLHSQPGTAFRYGQTGAAYEVLGAVIEIASGLTLEEFMQQNIFEPLGLEDSHFYLPAEKAARLPAVYRRNREGALELDRAAGEDFSRSTFFHGGGGVRSAPADIHRFARLFTGGGMVDGVRLLETGTVAMMLSDQLGPLAPAHWQEAGRSWGFGAAVRYSGGRPHDGLPDTYGWVGGGFTTLLVDPRRRWIAYINFPLTPPGDNDLLDEFGRLSRNALEEADRQPLQAVR